MVCLVAKRGKNIYFTIIVNIMENSVGSMILEIGSTLMFWSI